MSDFILMRTENDRTITEVITNTYLVGKILRTKYDFEETASGFLINSVEKRLMSLVKSKDTMVSTHEDIERAYKISSVATYYDKIFRRTKIITALWFPGITATTMLLSLGEKKIFNSYVLKNLANRVLNAATTWISDKIVPEAKELNYRYGDEFAKVDKNSKINQEELTRLNSIMAEYGGFLEKISKGSTELTLDTNSLINTLIKSMDIDNKNIIYSLLLMNRYYVLSILYLINNGAINSSFIENWISSNDSKPGALIDKLLDNADSSILNPMKRMLTRHAKNTKHTSSKSSLVEDIVKNVLSNVEKDISNIKENVMAGFGKYNMDSIYTNIADTDLTYDSDLSEFVFYDKNIAKDFADIPKYLDNTHLLGHVSNGILKKRHLRVDPEIVETIKLSIEEKNVSGYKLINDVVNFKFSEYIKQIYNNKKYDNFKPEVENIKYDIKDKIQSQLKNIPQTDSFFVNIINAAYGTNYNTNSDVFKINSPDFLKIIDFKSSSTITQLAKDLIKRVIGTDELLKTGIVSISDPNVIGKILLNKDLPNTSILSKLNENDLLTLLRTDLSISGGVNGIKNFRIKSNTTNNKYPETTNDDVEDISNSYILDNIGKFLDTNKCMETIRNIIDEVEEHIVFDTSIDSIISSYSYHISNRLQREAGANSSENNSLLIDYNINNIMVSIMLYELLDSYWYYLRYGETVFNRVSDTYNISSFNDKLYSRYINETFVFFKDTSLKQNSELFTNETSVKTHPVTGEEMYHYERITTLLRKTEDQVFYGHKVYYDIPTYDLKTDKVNVVLTTVKKVVAFVVEVVVKIVEVVVKIIKAILGFFGIKQTETHVRYETQVQNKTKEVIETLKTEVLNTSYSKVDINLLCSQLDDLTKINSTYDKISPYCWKAFMITDDKPSLNEDLMPFNAIDRIFDPNDNAEYTKTRAQKTINRVEENPDTKETKYYSYNCFQRIHFYEQGPRIYEPYHTYINNGGKALTGKEYDDYMARFNVPNKDTVGRAWSEDQISDTRPIYESIQSYYPTPDRLAQLINQADATVPYSTDYQGNITTELKSYYLGNKEKHWSYIENRIVFPNEFVDYFEEDVNVSNNHLYHKAFIPTLDEKAGVIVTSAGVIPKTYYRAVPGKQILSNKQYIGDTFILGKDFYLHSTNTTESFVPNDTDAFSIGNPIVNRTNSLNLIYYIPVKFETGRQIKYDYTRTAIYPGTSYAMFSTTNEHRVAVRPYKQIVKYVECTTAELNTWKNATGNNKINLEKNMYILDENNEYIPLAKDTSVPWVNQPMNSTVKNTFVVNTTKKFKKITVSDVSKVYFVGETIQASDYQNLYKPLENDGLFHPTISKDYFNFYKLMYFLRHMVLDFPEFLLNIKNTISWEEFVLSQQASKFNSYEEVEL